MRRAVDFGRGARGDADASLPRPFLARIARALPLPAGAGLARRLVERNVMAFRHGWLLLLTGFTEPVFYLFSLGIGLGAYLGTMPVSGGREVSYAAFVAPALLAASAMNGATFDATFNFFFKLKYLKLYDSVLATPMGPRDVALGETAWSLLRGTAYSAAFLLVAWAAGAADSWWAILAVPVAGLIGFAFATIGMFATSFMRSWLDFDYVTLALTPMFLFSATFFPLSAYPGWAQWLVQLTPLYHGVALERAVMLNDLGPEAWGHLAYLLGLGLLGLVGIARRVERLLLS